MEIYLCEKTNPANKEKQQGADNFLKDFLNSLFSTLKLRQNSHLICKWHIHVHFLEWKCLNFP